MSSKKKKSKEKEEGPQEKKLRLSEEEEEKQRIIEEEIEKERSEGVLNEESDQYGLDKLKDIAPDELNLIETFLSFNDNNRRIDSYIGLQSYLTKETKKEPGGEKLIVIKNDFIDIYDRYFRKRDEGKSINISENIEEWGGRQKSILLAKKKNENASPYIVFGVDKRNEIIEFFYQNIASKDIKEYTDILRVNFGLTIDEKSIIVNVNEFIAFTKAYFSDEGKTEKKGEINPKITGIFKSLSAMNKSLDSIQEYKKIKQEQINLQIYSNNAQTILGLYQFYTSIFEDPEKIEENKRLRREDLSNLIKEDKTVSKLTKDQRKELDKFIDVKSKEMRNAVAYRGTLAKLERELNRLKAQINDLSPEQKEQKEEKEAEKERKMSEKDDLRLQKRSDEFTGDDYVFSYEEEKKIADALKYLKKTKTNQMLENQNFKNGKKKDSSRIKDDVKELKERWEGIIESRLANQERLRRSALTNKGVNKEEIDRIILKERPDRLKILNKIRDLEIQYITKITESKSYEDIKKHREERDNTLLKLREDELKLIPDDAKRSFNPDKFIDKKQIRDDIKKLNRITKSFENVFQKPKNNRREKRKLLSTNNLFRKRIKAKKSGYVPKYKTTGHASQELTAWKMSIFGNPNENDSSSNLRNLNLRDIDNMIDFLQSKIKGITGSREGLRNKELDGEKFEFLVKFKQRLSSILIETIENFINTNPVSVNYEVSQVAQAIFDSIFGLKVNGEYISLSKATNGDDIAEIINRVISKTSVLNNFRKDELKSQEKRFKRYIEENKKALLVFREDLKKMDSYQKERIKDKIKENEDNLSKITNMETVLEKIKQEINDPDLSFGSTFRRQFFKGSVNIDNWGEFTDKSFYPEVYSIPDTDERKIVIDMILDRRALIVISIYNKLLSELYNDFVPTLDKRRRTEFIDEIDFDKFEPWKDQKMEYNTCTIDKNVGDIFYYKGKDKYVCINIQEIVNSDEKSVYDKELIKEVKAVYKNDFRYIKPNMEEKKPPSLPNRPPPLLPNRPPPLLPKSPRSPKKLSPSPKRPKIIISDKMVGTPCGNTLVGLFQNKKNIDKKKLSPEEIAEINRNCKSEDEIDQILNARKMIELPSTIKSIKKIRSYYKCAQCKQKIREASLETITTISTETMKDIVKFCTRKCFDKNKPESMSKADKDKIKDYYKKKEENPAVADLGLVVAVESPKTLSEMLKQAEDEAEGKQGKIKRRKKTSRESPKSPKKPPPMPKSRPPPMLPNRPPPPIPKSSSPKTPLSPSPKSSSTRSEEDIISGDFPVE